MGADAGSLIDLTFLHSFLIFRPAFIVPSGTLKRHLVNCTLPADLCTAIFKRNVCFNRCWFFIDEERNDTRIYAVSAIVPSAIQILTPRITSQGRQGTLAIMFGFLFCGLLGKHQFSSVFLSSLLINKT